MAIWLGVAAGPERARVLAQEGPRETILKARLRSPPAHPRALVALCEALALWSGEPVRAVLAVGEPVGTCDTTPWLGPGVPNANAFFELKVVPDRQPQRRRDLLGGLGDFRDLRQLVFFEVAE
jgi:hypothetical protein